MTQFSRYAIYYMPAPGPLERFGASWLGWDAQAGVQVAHIAVPGLPIPVEEITATPRKYGFHGTVKPPFRLSEGREARDLLGAARALCAAQEPFAMEGLRLHRLGHFLALTPLGEAGQLAALAGSMVRGLDPFRAPPSEAELARRRKAGLSPRQEALMQEWGYPYVMDEFRFHLTLTGRLAPEALLAVEAALAPILAPILADQLSAPFRVDSLCVAGEDAEGRFHLIERLPLGPAGRT